MTTLEILEKARELIATPEKWTQGALGRYEDGKIIGSARSVLLASTQGNVRCLCMLGACLVAEGNPIGVALGSRELEDALEIDAMDEFNDSHSHAEVLALFDNAIEKLKSQAVQQ